MKTTVKILDMIRENDKITRQELADALDITIDGVDWNIKKLKRDGIIERVGSDKSGHWILLKAPKE